jgi:uncharacterized tellurite resistance protein B-like protein
MADGFLSRIMQLFDGDPGIRRVADDPVLTAELLLLFRMILADGAVEEKELATFKRICTESFGIPKESLVGVIRSLQDYGYETTGTQALALFQTLDRDRRIQLGRHLAEIAKADEDLSEHEVRLLKRTLEVLDIDAAEIVGDGV